MYVAPDLRSRVPCIPTHSTHPSSISNPLDTRFTRCRCNRARQAVLLDIMSAAPGRRCVQLPGWA